MTSPSQKNFVARSSLEVNLSHLKENYKTLKQMSFQDSFFCPMVKDQAYGLGAVPVVQALNQEGARNFGVIDISEARELRQSIKQSVDILLFGPVLNKENLSWSVENGIILVINNWNDLEYLAQNNQSVKIHLKFDTGFSRLGFALSEAEKIHTFLKQNPNIHLEALCTQLILGEELGNEHSYSYQQIQKMQDLQSLFPSCFLHALNTSALYSLYKNEMISSFPKVGVRPGLGLYGIEPEVFLKKKFKDKKKDQSLLKPVSCLKSHIVNVSQLEKGDRVSYSGSWVAQRSSILVTISLGYGDGFLRGLLAQREILFRKQRVPIVGNVCMDFFMADVTDYFQNKNADPICLGEEVIIFGQQDSSSLSLEESAQKLGTISYEVLVRLGERVERRYVD